MPLNPFPEQIAPDKAEKIAARRTEQQKADAGLFAELIPPVTPEMVQDGAKAHHDKFQRALDELEIKAAWLKSNVAELVTPEALKEMEKRMAVLPDCPAYACDHWRRMLAENLEPFPLPND